MPGPSLSRGADRWGIAAAAKSFRSFRRHLRRALLTGAAWVAMPEVVRADEHLALPFGLALSTIEVVNLALVLGAVSAALISAIWLIRERAKIDAENTELRTLLSDANARVDRYHALIIDKDRRIVVWDGIGESPEVLGELPVEAGAPDAKSAFLAFGRWLDTRSAARLEKAIDLLRASGQRFDFVIETQRAQVLEAQGRVSGGRAFVRFVALGDMRARMAETTAERDRLVGAVETLQTLLDALDTPVWLRGPDGRLRWVNEAYAHAVEASSGEVAVERGSELIGTHAREKIRAATLTDRPFSDKVSTVVRGNRTIYDLVDARTATGSAGIATDVSEIESVREELQRTIRSHSETLDHLATAVAIFGNDQTLQFYNQAFQKLWALDMPFLESRPTNAEFLERLRADGKLSEQHSWRDWKDGMLAVYRSVEPQQNFWYLPDGQTLNVFATAHPQGGATWVFENLTEQVDLEARYNTLVKVQGETIDHLAEGVCVFGADGKLKLSNPAFRALWGITELDAAPGTHINAVEMLCRKAYAEEDGWRRFATIITSLDDERRTYEGRFELLTGLILDYAVVPLPNAQTMLTFVNSTDSVSVERALTEKNDALQRADALKNDFVKHVSYELRTPLTNIIGFADLLKTPMTGDLNERQAEYVDHIATSSSVLLMIVNDILDLATVDAGIMKLELSEVDIAEILAEAEAQMSDRLKEADLALSIDAPPGLGHFVADRQRVRQILSKLLSNAANHAPEGSRIRLTCHREIDSIVFSVSDEGPGIPSHMLKSIFSRFETHGPGGRRRGAGLGLSIVDSFVSLHKGTVEIDSVEGRGTTVTCRLPAHRTIRTEAAE
ncbi:sensor histidine kinase [Pararhizobium haloflavum]|uniref:sensor histidine kinase n=1 Tax=Pararhizobium haloflavum TaxID=2037914 RepID=UPI000C1996E7|nr:PAS domain-containing sensor histidine kinase [Pararhizobium haloflavum]